MVEAVLRAMNMDGPGRAVQRAQTAHRLRLIDFWEIAPGSRVLEIGCGQGDTLAALAYAVGADGFAWGIDIAKADYGCPETLGQARARLLGGSLSDRLRMDFDTDVLRGDVSFPEGAFDYLVLAHCLWYLPDRETLVRILARARPWAKRLCLAEWNAAVRTVGQWPHYEAVCVQAACAAFAPEEEFNVRTLLYPAQILDAVEESGWRVAKSARLPSAGMQDGEWEVETAGRLCPAILENRAALPDTLKETLLARLKQLRAAGPIEPLDTLCLAAERAPA